MGRHQDAGGTRTGQDPGGYSGLASISRCVNVVGMVGGAFREILGGGAGSESTFARLTLANWVGLLCGSVRQDAGSGLCWKIYQSVPLIPDARADTDCLLPQFGDSGIHPPPPGQQLVSLLGTPARFPGSSSSTATNPSGGGKGICNLVLIRCTTNITPASSFVFYGLKIDIVFFWIACLG